MISKEEFERMTGLPGGLCLDEYKPSDELLKLHGVVDFNIHEILADKSVAHLRVINEIALKSCLCVPAYQGNVQFESIIHDAICSVNLLIASVRVTEKLGFINDQDFQDIDIVRILTHGTAEEVSHLVIGLAVSDLVDESIVDLASDYPHNAASLTTPQCAALCMGSAIKGLMSIVELVIALREI